MADNDKILHRIFGAILDERQAVQAQIDGTDFYGHLAGKTDWEAMHKDFLDFLQSEFPADYVADWHSRHESRFDFVLYDGSKD